jgi:hypothetical protein
MPRKIEGDGFHGCGIRQVMELLQNQDAEYERAVFPWASPGLGETCGQSRDWQIRLEVLAKDASPRLL